MKKIPTMTVLMAVTAVLQVINGILQGNVDEAAIATAITAVSGVVAVFHHTKQVDTALYTPVPEPEVPVEDIVLPDPGPLEGE